MAKQIFKVNGMSCEHCVSAVTNAIGAIDGVTGVKVNLAENSAVVEYDGGKTAVDAIKAAIEDEGYEAVVIS